MTLPRHELRELTLLAFLALLLFTAQTEGLALPALDDCFYARKAVEMARRGFSFTVTWAGAPTFQNPPAQLWLTAAAFRLLGENDFAARLPSALMAVGILLATWRIGRLTLGGQAPLVAVALLVLSPGFVNNARRSMMEIPLTFWSAIAVLAFLEGFTHRRWLAVLALGLGAAVLTKSVLGFLPLFVIACGVLLVPQWRGAARSPWVWMAVLGGLLLGSTWSIDQAQRYGSLFVGAHYGSEILERSSQPTSFAAAAFSYPKILLLSYQPVILPAIVGAGLILQAWRAHRGPAILLAAWAFLPVLVYSLSSARTPRYVFPLFPALALCAAVALVRGAPKLARALPRIIAPGVALLGALIFALRPELLSRPGTLPFKQQAHVLRAAIPPHEPVPYLGSRYWNHANPMLYYAERLLDGPSTSAREALAVAGSRPSRMLLVDRDHLQEALANAPHAERLVEAPAWVLLRLQPAARVP